MTGNDNDGKPGLRSMATGGSRPSAVTSVCRLGHAPVRETYSTTTAKIKGRKEEIVIVDETGASVDGNGRQSIATGRATVRRYGRGSYSYGRS